MFYTTNQSHHWKKNQSEVAISGRLPNRTEKKKYEKKYGNKFEGKSHVTSGQDLLRSLLVKHAQCSDPLDPPQMWFCPYPYTTLIPLKYFNSN
jgi:hypothetical protein